MGPKNKVHCHIIINTLNIQNKERRLKIAREKDQVASEGRYIKITTDFSMETLKDKGYSQMF